MQPSLLEFPSNPTLRMLVPSDGKSLPGESAVPTHRFLSESRISCPTSAIQDVFKHLPTAPDLDGQVTVQSHQPVYSGSFSRVYRGELKQGARQVCPF
jgi:hypothetical protein